MDQPELREGLLGAEAGAAAPVECIELEEFGLELDGPGGDRLPASVRGARSEVGDPTSITGCVLTLVNTVVGVGVLSIPFCFSKAGLLLASKQHGLKSKTSYALMSSVRSHGMTSTMWHGTIG